MKMLNVAKLSRIFERATFYKRRPIADRHTHTRMLKYTQAHTNVLTHRVQREKVQRERIDRERE